MDVVRFNFELTDEQAEKLLDQLLVADEGPEGEGWCSELLERVSAIVRQAASSPHILEPVARVSAAARLEWMCDHETAIRLIGSTLYAYTDAAR
jgi:hypothetical protein